jgi:formate dehydrogenase subunit beta
MDIRNSLFMHALQTDLEKMFGHTPGVDMSLPVLALVEEPTERARLASTGSDQIYDIFKK